MLKIENTYIYLKLKIEDIHIYLFDVKNGRYIYIYIFIRCYKSLFYFIYIFINSRKNRRQAKHSPILNRQVSLKRIYKATRQLIN